MNVEATLLPQMVDHTVRVFDPMLDEAAQVDHIPPRAGDTGLIGSEARSGRPDLLDLDIFSDQIMPEPVRQPPPEVVVANSSAAVEAAASVELEPVLFDVQDSSGCEFQSTIANLRNVTVARGTWETLPLHFFAGTDAFPDELVTNFKQSICREVPPPVLQTLPPRRKSHPQPQEFTIWRSERLAKKSRHRATKPVVQAQNVLMKKLGITSDTRPPDASSFQQFTATF
ncbi:hypothetical protein PVAP13_3NG140895 [Panicum virgatum]|uniref:Uncharacterized protein n=1 Tax=Panicum virgatum TaxID=38727 RepID=A0A8T0UED0_PANVG|nr:hypothetical protein PVAP13_3NG140895 [Panicum virgatum]